MNVKHYFIFFFLFIFSSFLSAQNSYRFFTNNINMPMNNRGVLADVNIPPHGQGGRYDDIYFLFSGGFFLTGINNDTIWTNGVASANLVNDYEPGPVGSLPGNPENKIYVIKSSDPSFGQSWLDYSDAVDLGADFYDGNNDGLYNPADLNGNNQWDPEEDRPDILGDVTAWCVYNDGVPANLRRFIQNPLGIEIQQTIFAYTQVTAPYLNNTIFLRYRILNKGTQSNLLDSVFFSFWNDADIGESHDDSFGTDTLLNSGYTYSFGNDIFYGINSPSFFSTILQGPYVYIPGITFIDLNSNGVFDEGTDTPLDTAVNNKGNVLGKQFYPGAKNLMLETSMMIIKGHPSYTDPNNEVEARNLILARSRQGEIIDPCNFPFGEVLNVNCEEVNPLKVFSGDLITNTGWISNFKNDIRSFTSAGPFKLEANKPVDIIVAYNVGRGADSLDSIIKGRAVTRTSIDFYNSNFSDLTVDVPGEISTPASFELSQNYPNPFNPATTIKYSIPFVKTHRDASQLVSLKVYDVLGNEVATLVNEEKPAGTYEVQFDASHLTSGIYFYQIKAKDFIESKKMVLIK